MHESSTMKRDLFAANDKHSSKKGFKKKKQSERTNEKMKNIISNIEKEIENQLDMKNEKNDFTTTNIHAILKEVIMDEDIKEMVRQTLHPQGSKKCIYEPKLTRAKIRELLKLRPDLSFPILWPLPAQKNTNFISECLSLINEDYSENSSEDEEYRPDEFDQTNLEEFSLNVTGVSEGSNLEICEDTTFDLGAESGSTASNNGKADEENIGQRTRSKLPLIDTPLEVIEQAFVPPDITTDMYDSDCDDEDWLNFMVEFLKPLDNKVSEHADAEDDLENDPEYNILTDEETVDKEEMRKDRGVEVPQKEVDDLIAELIRDCVPINPAINNLYATENPQSAENNTVVEEFTGNETTASSTAVEKDECHSSQEKSVSTLNSTNSDMPIILKPQRLLLRQQLQQHVQLTAMHFLQCYKHPVLFRYAADMKVILISLKNLSVGNENSMFSISNLDSAIKLIEEWVKLQADVPEPKPDVFIKFPKRMKKQVEFPANLKKIVCMSDMVLYPLLLPHKPFISCTEMGIYKIRAELLPSEEWLLSVGLEQFCEYVKDKNLNNKSKNVIFEACKLIAHYMLPFFTPTFLYKYVKKLRSDNKANCIKTYFENSKAPLLKHYVLPVTSKPLYKQPMALLPVVWRDYIESNFYVILKKT